MPEVVTAAKALREMLRHERRSDSSIGFVPTMGALHSGHARLLEHARGENDLVVASIFVNPLQFDRKDDFDRYPQTPLEDLQICAQTGVDVVFAPTAAELYPCEQLTFVDVPALSRYLCGQYRPGHFRGVATVVLKLFNLVQPDTAYFGEKDAQQLAVIRRMVADLNLPVEVIGVPTVREADGLALSSRNKHLTPAEREVAPVLSRVLREAVNLVESGERAVSHLRNRLLPLFAAHPEVRVEYLEIVDPGTLMRVESIDAPVLIAGAIWIGPTRLIDNVSWPEKKERN